jgi:hypothetical protein
MIAWTLYWVGYDLRSGRVIWGTCLDFRCMVVVYTVVCIGCDGMMWLNMIGGVQHDRWCAT